VIHAIDSTCGPGEVHEAAGLAGGLEGLICVGPAPEGLKGSGRIRTVRPAARRIEAGLRDALADGAVAHCWSVRAAMTLGRWALRRRLVIRLSGAPSDEQIDELFELGRLGRATVVAARPADAQALADAGAPAERVVIPPAAFRAPARAGGRAEAREAIGLAPGEVAVVACGRAHRRSGHRTAAWAAAILHVAGLRLRLVIQRTGPGARQVARFAREAGFAEPIVLVGAEAGVSDLLAATDVALFAHRGPPPPALLAGAMGTGLGIVATHAADGEWGLADGRSALLVPPEAPRATARAILRLIEDRPFAARLAKAARAAARKHLDPKSLRRQWDAVYAACTQPPGR